MPDRFLGGPIWSPLNPTTGIEPGADFGAPVGPDGNCAPGDPDCVVFENEDELETLPVGDLEDPERGLVFELPETDDLIPDEIDDEPVEEGGDDEPADEEGGAPPGEGQSAAALGRRPRAAPVARPPTPAELEAARGGLLSPGPASWLRWQRPVLRWRPQARTDVYNVQIFRGTRRVLAAWTEQPRLRVRDGVLRQGRTYTWVVWPASGPRGDERYGAPIGRSTFAITLRPRIVFHTSGRGRTVGEIRPRIPRARIAFRAPKGVAGVPGAISANRRSLFVLPVRRRNAERLKATLRSVGPRPPVGLRGGRQPVPSAEAEAPTDSERSAGPSASGPRR